jgi:hypothetical protein
LLVLNLTSRKFRAKSFASLIAGAAMSIPAFGAVNYTTDGSTITVTWDETFILNTADFGSGYMFLIVEDVFDVPGPSEEAYFSGVTSMSQLVSINGGTGQSVTDWTGWQYRPGPEHDYSSVDAAFGLDTGGLPAVAAGDTFRWTGSMTVNVSNPEYRMPDNPGSTTAYLAANEGTYSNVISTVVTVPEPSSVGLLAGSLLLAFRRRRA